METVITPEGQTLTQVDRKKKGGPKKNTPKGEIVVTSPTELLAATSQELDSTLERINEYKSDMWAGAYKIGIELTTIVEKQLWKQRLDETNKPLYKNFETFVKAECGITDTYARQMLKVVQAYSETEAAGLGISKLGLIVEAPPDMQQRLLERAKDGATHEQLLSEVKEANEKRRQEADQRGEKRSRRGDPSARKGSSTTSVKKSDAVTIAVLQGPHRVELFMRAQNDDGEHLRAKTIGDQPWGSLALENGVSMQFTVRQDGEGNLFLAVKTARAE